MKHWCNVHQLPLADMD